MKVSTFAHPECWFFVHDLLSVEVDIFLNWCEQQSKFNKSNSNQWCNFLRCTKDNILNNLGDIDTAPSKKEVTNSQVSIKITAFQKNSEYLYIMGFSTTASREITVSFQKKSNKYKKEYMENVHVIIYFLKTKQKCKAKKD